MRWSLVILALLAFVGSYHAAPVKDGKGKDKVEVWEIDFGPVPDNSVYNCRIVIKTKSHVFDETFQFAGCNTGQMRGALGRALKSAGFTAIQSGETRLNVEDCEGEAVLSVEISTEKLEKIYDPVARKIPKPKGPVEINFAPLGDEFDSSEGYEIRIVVKSEEGKLHEKTHPIKSQPAKDARDAVLRAMEKEGWAVEAVGDNSLVIRGYKDSPVSRIDLKIPKMSSIHQPIISLRKK